MTVNKKQLDEKIQTGGGATGVAHNADPVDKKATLPASHLGNGEPMPKVADVTPGQGEEDTSTENNVKATKDAAAANKASVAMKASGASASMKEDVAAMFNGEDLSEEFKEKATVIFEAAVTAQASEIAKDLEEQYNAALAEEVTRIEAEMTEKVDQYLDYAVGQWMEENKVAVEHTLRTEVTESFIADLHKLFTEHYITVPEDKFDVVESLEQQLAEMQQQLDSAIEDNISLLKVVDEASRSQIIASVAEGLSATQAEKLVALAEGVEYDSAENFQKKLEIVKENYFPTEKAAGKAQALMEQVEEQSDDAQQPAPANSPVSFYAQAISRTVKK